MRIEVLARGAFGSALVGLEPGESLVSESGAMFRASSNVEIDVSTRPKGSRGGILAGVKRLLGGEHFFFSHVSTAFEYPRKPAGVPSFLTRGRPTAGNEIISSRHFPAETQGTHLVNQMIGFHGTRWDRLVGAGSGR